MGPLSSVINLACCSGRHRTQSVRMSYVMVVIVDLIIYSTAPQLVAMGTFMNPDTTRVIAKRVILTGHPFKVHKKTATVRYMFFNSGPLSALCINTALTLPFDLGQMTYNISNPFNCTLNADAQDISVNLWALTAISKHTSMDPLTKWTQCACLCTSGCSPSGVSYGRKTEVHVRCLLMQWRSEGDAVDTS